jgi:hypothetical protein
MHSTRSRGMGKASAFRPNFFPNNVYLSNYVACLLTPFILIILLLTSGNLLYRRTLCHRCYDDIDRFYNINVVWQQTRDWEGEYCGGNIFIGPLFEDLRAFQFYNSQETRWKGTGENWEM